jgi:hypothetical protein
VSGENEVKIKRRNFKTVYISFHFAHSFAELWVNQWQNAPFDMILVEESKYNTFASLKHSIMWESKSNLNR